MEVAPHALADGASREREISLARDEDDLLELVTTSKKILDANINSGCVRLNLGSS